MELIDLLTGLARLKVSSVQCRAFAFVHIVEAHLEI